MTIVIGLILMSLSCFIMSYTLLHYYASYVGNSVGNIKHNIHSQKIIFVRNVSIIWTIFSSCNMEGYWYLRIFCIPWSNVVLFNHNLWSSTPQFRNVRCDPAVICNCCMLLYRSPCDCSQGCVCMCLFTWQGWIMNQRAFVSQECIFVSKAQECSSPGCFSALHVCLVTAVFFISLKKKEVKSSTSKGDWVLIFVFQEKG